MGSSWMGGWESPSLLLPRPSSALLPVAPRPHAALSRLSTRAALLPDPTTVRPTSLHSLPTASRMFFYSPHSKQSSVRRQTLTPQSGTAVGHIDTRLSVHIAENLYREHEGAVASANERDLQMLRYFPDDHVPLEEALYELIGAQHIPPPVPGDEEQSLEYSLTDSRRASRAPHIQRRIVLRRATNTAEEGKIIIDHVGARWDGVPMASQSGGPGGYMDAEDGATVATDTIKDDEDRQEPKSCPQQTVKYIKILTPHIILVSVLIGYLCLGAWILMLLETKTELQARSRKLTRVTNLITNYTKDSWNLIQHAQDGVFRVDEDHWRMKFREYILSISETVDDRRPIRRELNRPDDLNNMHNKWTFPTSLLYVLTVLTTCGYGEVSVDTDFGKIFSVAFALVGIPLMFITAADIGKFLSESLLKAVAAWGRLKKKVKSFCGRARYGRRKSVQSSNGNTDTMDILGNGETEDKLWFPIGAYVGCICLYCTMGSFMFINWEKKWSFLHAFHFGFNLIVTVGLGDIVVVDYIFLSLIVAFVIVGLSVVTMCVDLASTHLKAYFTRIHYFGRAKRFLGMSEELKEIVALLGAMRRKKGGKVTWNDVRDFLDNELRDRPFEPHELLMKLRFIDETSSGMSTIRHNSFQSDFYRESEYIRRVNALRPEQPAFL